MDIFILNPLTTIINEETFHQDILKHLKEMFSLHYIHSDIFIRFNYVCFPSTNNVQLVILVCL